MASRTATLLALSALSALSAGCPPPPPPPPPPAPVAVAPLPPKCESFSEKCVAGADTRAKITNTALVFTPATSWVYAQQSSATVAQASDSGPVIVFLGIDVDVKDLKKQTATKDAAIVELCKQAGLSPLKRKVTWAKPDDKKSLGVISLDLWQLDEAGVRGPKKGPLLVVAGVTPSGKGIVGLGFVPDDDKSASDAAIMKSIESIGIAK